MSVFKSGDSVRLLENVNNDSDLVVGNVYVVHSGNAEDPAPFVRIVVNNQVKLVLIEHVELNV